MHEILRFGGCFFHIFRERYAPYMLHDSKNIYVSGKTHGDNYARLTSQPIHQGPDEINTS